MIAGGTAISSPLKKHTPLGHLFAVRMYQNHQWWIWEVRGVQMHLSLAASNVFLHT